MTCCLLTITAKSQGLVNFKLTESKIIFPAFVSGMMPDSTAALSGDTFVYKVPGQWFLEQPVLLGQNSTPALSTPYETLNELVIAFAGKNSDKIISLYSPAERSQIRDVIKGTQGGELLDYYAGAKNVVLLGAIKYRNGFMLYSKDDLYGVHENYITIKNGKYYITPLNDGNAAINWNIGLYLKHQPKPLNELPTFSFPDSLSTGDSIKIESAVPEKYWIHAFYSTPREMIPYRIEDNGPQDLNPELGKIKFYIQGAYFPGGKGEKLFYLASTNFPVMYVAPTLLKFGRAYKLKLF